MAAQRTVVGEDGLHGFAQSGVEVASLKCGDKEWKKADAEVHVEDGQVFVAA